MAEPIRNARVNNLAEAPTPQNTPATATSSFLQRAAAADGKPSVPTISEDVDTSLANNLSLISMIQGKLGTLVGKPSGYISSLPEPIKDRIRGLKALQSQHAELESQLEEEILALEKKWHKKYEPLYAKRAKIVVGDLEPTQDEIEQGKKIEDEQEEQADESRRLPEIKEDEDDEEEEEDDGIKGIPDFWLTVFKNLPAFEEEEITDRDEEALHHLLDVRMEYMEEPGFRLVFEFSENPFFSNKTLTKTYYYSSAPDFNGEYSFDHAEGTDIDWKSPEQNLTVTIEKRKQRNKRTQQTRTIEKTVPGTSFFNFFTPPGTNDGDDEDETAELIQLVEIDYRTGEEIKNMLPKAVEWFTGEALFYASGDEDEKEEDEDDYEDDSEDDEDEDDEEGESVIKSGGGAAGGEQPAECKQQ